MWQQNAASPAPKLFFSHWYSLRTRYIDIVILKTAEKGSCGQNRTKDGQRGRDAQG